jgi:hypothetical protein
VIEMDNNSREGTDRRLERSCRGPGCRTRVLLLALELVRGLERVRAAVADSLCHRHGCTNDRAFLLIS